MCVKGRDPGSAIPQWLHRDPLSTLPHAHPRELREKIQPEILELIKQQRLNRLCEGSSFRKIGNRRRQGEGAWGTGLGLTAWPPHAGSKPGPPAFPREVRAHCFVSLVFQSASGTAAWH